MEKTAEKILITALALFARYGYDATSMSDIASELKITKGALYRHYENKRAIFDAILEKMRQRDREQAHANDVPEESLQAAPESYRDTSLESICSFSMEMFRYWTEDAFASDFRRMLALERYRDPEMMALYQNYLCAGPLAYVRDMFAEMAGAYGWQRDNVDNMATEFYGAMYMLMDASDAMQDKEAAEALKQHFKMFCERYDN